MDFQRALGETRRGLRVAGFEQQHRIRSQRARMPWLPRQGLLEAFGRGLPLAGAAQCDRLRHEAIGVGGSRHVGLSDAVHGVGAGSG